MNFSWYLTNLFQSVSLSLFSIIFWDYNQLPHSISLISSMDWNLNCNGDFNFREKTEVTWSQDWIADFGERSDRPGWCDTLLKNSVLDMKNRQSKYSKWHTITNFLWLQPSHIQHFQMICMPKAFQNIACFQQIPSQVWNDLVLLCAIFFHEQSWLSTTSHSS